VNKGGYRVCPICLSAPLDFSNYKSDTVEPYTAVFTMNSNGGENYDLDSKTDRSF